MKKLKEYTYIGLGSIEVIETDEWEIPTCECMGEVWVGDKIYYKEYKATTKNGSESFKTYKEALNYLNNQIEEIDK